MCNDPTNENRELDREWKRLIKFVKEKVPYGVLTIEFINGKPVASKEMLGKMRFDRPVERV